MNHYELLDFGAGRKLERFGAVILDRPAPAADDLEKSRPVLWGDATARYERTAGNDGRWIPDGALPDSWRVFFALHDDRELTFELQPSPFGHVGVFAEQANNWRWIFQQVRRAGRPLRVLNLFAYSGGSTLAAAAAGAEVVHVDAARNMVQRARRNAELTGLADRTVRWIVEDAMKFCGREVKRGNQYDAVILDPPSYGHGPKGEVWKIEKSLLQLLELCGTLTGDRLAFTLVTCHSPGFGPAELSAYLADGMFGHCGQPPASGELVVSTADGRKLPGGIYSRWPR